MRTEKLNPAFRRFGHLLPGSGLYPAKWVDIFSNTDEDLKYSEVEVVFIPRGADLDLDEEFWDEFADYNSRWLGDLGNSVAGWMEPGGLNPEKVFGGMLWYGFSDRRVLDSAVAEFAAIEECSWARQMSEGEFSEVLGASMKGGAAALDALLKMQHHHWAEDMLSAVRRETDF